MDQILSKLFSAQGPIATTLFWTLVAGIIVCIAFPDRMVNAKHFRKSVIGLLSMLGLHAASAVAYGLIALVFSGDGGRAIDRDFPQFLMLTNATSSLLAGLEWGMLTFAFWHLFRAYGVELTATKAARATQQRAQSKQGASLKTEA